MVTFYVDGTAKSTVEKLAEKQGLTKAQTYRALLSFGLERAESMPNRFKTHAQSLEEPQP